ncbi:formylglycine-generating enzyme family protein, partial [Dyella kyungheensis]
AARSRGKHVLYATDNGYIERGRNYRGEGESKTYAVDKYPPNPLGLYDMGGNATSWINDWYDPEYYQHSPVDDPRGPATGTEKVIRGAVVIASPDLTFTMARSHDTSVLKDYYSTNSYRCAIQQSTPLKR